MSDPFYQSNRSWKSSVTLQGREVTATPPPPHLLVHNSVCSGELGPSSVPTLPFHHFLFWVPHHSLLPPTTPRHLFWNQAIRDSTFQRHQMTRSRPVICSVSSPGTDLRDPFPHLRKMEVICSVGFLSALEDFN